ncbi:SRPBCC family protein [Sinomicrobium oceani]|nr:hypothetical protein [Sinomicrobium oceani]
MKAEFILNTDIPTVIAQFRNARNLIQWSVAAETCEIYPEADNTWETYICFDFPWPLRSRDLITQNELRVSGDTTVILMNSIPQSRPKVTGNKRISSYQAIWRFTPVSKKRIRVVHMVVTYDPPEFPRVLADPIIQNKFITSVERLRQQI